MFSNLFPKVKKQVPVQLSSLSGAGPRGNLVTAVLSDGREVMNVSLAVAASLANLPEEFVERVAVEDLLACIDSAGQVVRKPKRSILNGVPIAGQFVELSKGELEKPKWTPQKRRRDKDQDEETPKEKEKKESKNLEDGNKSKNGKEGEMELIKLEAKVARIEAAVAASGIPTRPRLVGTEGKSGFYIFHADQKTKVPFENSWEFLQSTALDIRQELAEAGVQNLVDEWDKVVCDAKYELRKNGVKEPRRSRSVGVGAFA